MRETDIQFVQTIFYKPSELEKANGIWPILVGRSKAKPNYSAGLRVPLHFSLHIVLDGKLFFQTKNMERILKAGDIFCLYPGETYHYRIAYSERPLCLTWLAFNGERASGFLESVGITSEMPIMERGASEEVINLLNEFTNEFSKNSQSNKFKICSMMYELFHYLSKNTYDIGKGKEWIQDAVDFINLHYSQQGFRVQDVAKSIGIDRSHLTKKFIKHMGISPKKYILELQMKKGASMLTETLLSVTEIAIALGYPNLYSFSRSFSSYYKKSPQQYRKSKAVVNFD